MVKRWFTVSRCVRTGSSHAEHSGRKTEVATPDTIEIINNIVLTDRRLKVCQLVEALGLSHGSVVSILMTDSIMHLGRITNSINGVEFQKIQFSA